MVINNLPSGKYQIKKGKFVPTTKIIGKRRILALKTSDIKIIRNNMKRLENAIVYSFNLSPYEVYTYPKSKVIRAGRKR